MTGKQKAFADKILAEPTKPKKQIVKEVYNVTTDRAAEVMASENLRKPAIMAYLNKHAEQAEKTLYDVMNSSSKYGQADSTRDGAAHASVAVAAAKDILDRVHGKAKQSVDVHSTSVVIGIDLSGVSVQPEQNT